MRRWQEFGNSGGIFGDWQYSSNTRKSGPRPAGQGALPPAFVSMPHKDRTLAVLQSASTAQNIQFLCCKFGASDEPAGDCTAQHVPSYLTYCSPAIVTIGGIVAVWAGVPIFNENDDFTGSFGPSFFSGFTTEPPDEFGG